MIKIILNKLIKLAFYVHVITQKSYLFLFALVIASFLAVLEISGLIAIASLLTLFNPDATLSILSQLNQISNILNHDLSKISNHTLQIYICLFLLFKYMLQLKLSYLIFKCIYIIRLNLSNKIILQNFERCLYDTSIKTKDRLFIRNLTYGIDHVTDNGLIAIVHFFKDMLTILIIIGGILFNNIDFFVPIFLTIFLALLLCLITSYISKRYGFLIKKITLEIVENIIDLSNISKYLVFSNKTYTFYNKFNYLRRKQISTMLRYASIQLSIQPIFELFIIAFLLFYIIYFANQKNSLDFEVLSLGIVTVIRLIPLFSRIMASINSINYSLPYIKDLAINLSNKKRKVLKTELKQSTNQFIINFQSLSTSRVVLIRDKFTIILYNNSITEIKGYSGSGKSTLINNIALTLATHKINFGFLEQAPTFFNGSILDNLTLKDNNIDYPYLKFLIDLFGLLDNFLLNLNDFLHLRLYDNGKNLSGGQKKRLGLVREIYKRPKILILDEPTAGLDNDSSADILRSIVKISNELIILFTSHDTINTFNANNVYEIYNSTIKLLKKPN